MRFIGNKEKLVKKIDTIFEKNNINGDSFFDFFGGTTSVSKYFKKKGLNIIISDLLYFSFVLQQAYIINNRIPKFNLLLRSLNLPKSTLFQTNLESIIDYLNCISPNKGFIFHNYSPEGTQNLEIPRMYFTGDNAMKIDAIRMQIEYWYKSNLLLNNEYYILISCLIETVPFYSNISGVYAAFHKKWDQRALKKFILRPIEILTSSKKTFKSYNIDSVKLLKKVTADIFYLDPPYNQRQYAPNYHILETIAKYDNPKINGVAGLREYALQKSQFCNAKTGIHELDKIAKIGKFKFLIMSYNTEGIMQREDIIDCLSKYGKVKCVEFDYLRFKSNNNGESKNKKFIKEQLYILKKE
jgi:adenine-specific DNA-methyltransferase